MKLIYGRAGSGKSEYVLNEVAKSINDGNKMKSQKALMMETKKYILLLLNNFLLPLKTDCLKK